MQDVSSTSTWSDERGAYCHVSLLVLVISGIESHTDVGGEAGHILTFGGDRQRPKGVRERHDETSVDRLQSQLGESKLNVMNTLFTVPRRDSLRVP